jgi:hypothetical protein
LLYPISRVVSEEVAYLLGFLVYDTAITHLEPLLNDDVLAAYPNDPDAKELKFIVILSIKSATIEKKFTSELTLTDAKLTLLGSLRGAAGGFLPREVTGFKNKVEPITCNSALYSQLHARSDVILGHLANSSKLALDPSVAWIYLYSLNILKLSDEWKACTAFLDTLVTAKTKTVTEDIISCPYAFSDPDHDSDPCCSPVSEWQTPCVAAPGDVEVSVVITNEDAIMILI